MKLTELLLWMHADFKVRLDRMERIVREGGVGEATKLAHELSRLLQALEAHEWLEEQALHPSLRADTSAGSAEAAHADRVDHRALNAKILELKEALRHPQSTLSLFLAAEEFIVQLRRHMAQEERGVLRMAEERLGPELLEMLGEEALRQLKEAGLPEDAVPSSAVP